MNHISRLAAGILLATLALLSAASLSAYAAPPGPQLGAAESFVVLGGAGVTCTASTVTGNVGSKVSVTRTPTCSIAGSIHEGAAAVPAFNAFVTGYNALKALPCEHNLTAMSELAGKTLAPGVYCFNTTASLTNGTLRLAGEPSGVWVFQVGTALTTGTAQVVMDGGQACNVYWALGTAGTIGTGTKFLGNILAGSAVTFTGANSSLVGRALAKTEVTMTGTTISGCGGAVVEPPEPQDGNNGDDDQDHQDSHGDGQHDHDGNHDQGDHKS